MPLIKAYAEKKLLLATRLADLAIPALVGLIALVVYLPEHWDGHETEYLLALVVASALTANFFHLLGLYRIDALANVPRQVGRATFGWVMVAMVLLVAAFALKVSSTFPRVWATMWFIGALAGFLSVRAVVGSVLEKWRAVGRLTRDIAIVGAGPHGRRLIQHLKQNGDADVRIVGVFDERAARPMPAVEGVPVLGTIEDLISYARTSNVDQIVVAMPWTAEQRVMGVLKQLWELPIAIRLAPDMIGFRLSHCSYGEVGGVPVLNVLDRPLSVDKLILKRLEDFALAIALLIAFSPIMIATAIAIKLTSKGPILFRQTRYGFNNQPIQVYKFRSMYTEDCVDLAPTQTAEQDPRVTPVGRFIRRTSIDEMPQLFNVLEGSMSVVGPRPHPIGVKAADVLFEEAVAEYAARHRVKPGLTGWAQVNGWRGQTDTVEKIQRRVDHDLYYIENWSLLFDLKIVFMTIFSVLRGKNAW